jgi:dTDP-4-amino-4,6-dideoxygalactose transaminase
MGELEKRYVEEAFQTNWIAPLGPNVTNFENDIKNFYGGDLSCAALSSGTAALHLALILLGVGRDDEVLCQSFTFSASANPISYLGAKPVFIDSESATWNLCPELLEKAIKDRVSANKLPKAIVAVDLYGMPYQIDDVRFLSNKYGIPVIEDSAEALGSSWNGQKCGSFGDISILSFNGNKIITTSGGGALLSKDSELTRKAIHLATQARDDAPHYQHSTTGYNYRMSNVLAGIGRGQMAVLEDRVRSRRNNFEFYATQLAQLEDVELLMEPHGFHSNRWLTCILTDSFETRENIRKSLFEKQIESRPLWKPMHLQPVFENDRKYENGVSEDLFNRGLCLPSGSNLTEDQRNIIVETIIKVYQDDKRLCTK